jgi:hypothetical protein
MGCMGVGAVSEFGTADLTLVELRAKVTPVVFARLVERLREGLDSQRTNPPSIVKLEPVM